MSAGVRRLRRLLSLEAATESPTEVRRQTYSEVMARALAEYDTVLRHLRSY